ncbi:Purine efflux pump PbuE [Arthrobacter ulcerisalmonis]|jgi:predicted MFS family arabinose efflux permease|uniref:Purine efflux pump PbuE n=2 Tax=Arthrobacter ulcerisalmonis TaxID=2483813 RepID=A0A3P5XEN9_9MICC|nr:MULTISPECIES: MFS transporter [Micrococcales]MCB8043776.1 MFS transporter [Microbacterium oxydans]VDC33272.1 Purine efflux pump PbuE [Arthrobacter ulcerisalmonis]
MSTRSTPLPLPGTAGPHRAWPILAVLTAATLLTVTVEMLPSGLLPVMSADLGVSESAIGLLVSAWALTIAIVGIPLVRLTIRLPRTPLLAACLIVIAAANLLTATASSLPLALTGRILAATAHGLFWALVVSYVASVITAERLGRALAIVLAGPTLAGLAGLPIAAALADVVGWRAIFIGLSVALVMTAAVLWLILPQVPSTMPAGGGGWDRSASRVIAVAIAGGLVLVGHFAVFTYLTALVTQLGRLPGATIPLMLLVFGVSGAVGIAGSGFASDRYPRGAIVAAATLVTVGLAVLALSSGQPVVFIIGVAIWGIAVGAFPPILQTRVMRVSTSAFRPLAGSIVVTVLNLGVAAGATLGGLVLDHGPIAVTLIAVTAAAVGTFALALMRPLNTPHEGTR